MHITQILASLLLIASLSSCASSPQLYPNEKFKRVGKSGAQQDIDLCQEQADEYMESGKGKQIAKGAGTGAAIGAATGAVLGIFTGNVGSNALVGGAVGGTAGGASAALSPSQIKRNFVDQCLSERGYRVLGWE
jgi:outer membrane lipoprotein SlyB